MSPLKLLSVITKKLFNFLKVTLIIVVTFLFIINLFIYFINKDKFALKTDVDPIQKNRDYIFKQINDPELNKTKEEKLTILLSRAVSCGFIGEACTNNPSDGDKNFQKSLFGYTAKLISVPFVNPPASGLYWAYSGLQNSGFVPKTYAAEGIGFAAIKPFIKIWVVFRNLAFVVLVLVLISIGFMIMFRMKINPQTVISVENSLPKIVIALLLITFSYAIAGFMIDLMYIIILITISTLSTVNIDQYTTANSFNLINEYVGAGPGKLFPATKYNFLTTGNYLLSILPFALGGVLKTVGGYITTFAIASWINDKLKIETSFKGFNGLMAQGLTFGVGVGNLVGNWALVILYWVVALVIIMPLALPLVVGLLVAFTIVFLFFRIFFLLLTNYIQILLLIFFAPIILIFEAIPGKGTFSWWFKNLLANLLVFPLVILIILISDIILKINAQTTANQFWSPPFLYPLNQDAMTVLIGIGIYLIIPDLIKLVKEALGAKGTPFNLGIGTFFGGAAAAWSGAQASMGSVTSLAQMPILGQWLLQKGYDTQTGRPKGILGKIFPVSRTDTLLHEISKNVTPKNPNP